MAPASGRSRSHLRNSLDKEVYQVVRKLLDDHDKKVTEVKFYTVYDWIQKSNSSLKRKQKKHLEDSIDRVLAVLEDQDAGEDDMDSFEGDLGDDTDPQPQNSEPTKTVNDLITRSWNTATPPAVNGAKESKKREVQGTPPAGPEKKKARRERGAKDAEKSQIDVTPPSHTRLEDIGGVDNIKAQMKDHLVLPLLDPQEYVNRKIPIPRGILLHGPPGCGKTVLSRAFAAELGVPFIEILGPSVVSGMSGESERQVRELFEKAKESAPCLIFIDEIDVIAPKRESSQSQMEKRIVAQLLISMDSLAMESNDGKPVIVLAATNRPDALDPALRRGGRFDTEINMGVPNESMRGAILRALTRNAKIAADVNFDLLARKTSGFVGADLRDLVGKAGTWSMDRYREALERQAAVSEMDVDDFAEQRPVSAMDRSIKRLIKRVKDKEQPRPTGFDDYSIAMAAFEAVLPTIQPSSKREGFATVPDTTWDDVGSLEAVRKAMKNAIVEPIKNPEKLRRFGITAPTGVLLWGPPGCGKTLLAKAAAAESQANFISIKGPELLNKYVGESERAVRQVFTRARSSIPCVVFFDELDALVPRRNDGLSEASARVVNTLLTELDGLDAREGIYVIATTNRPDMIDEAMLRPGRLETLLFVGLPGRDDRVEILRALIKKTPIDPVLADFAAEEGCSDYSGADLASLLRKAGEAAMERNGSRVEWEDFKTAMMHVRPSVGDVARYEKMKARFGTGV